MELQLGVVEAAGTSGGTLRRGVPGSHVHLGIDIGLRVRSHVQIHIAGHGCHLRSTVRSWNQTGHTRRDVHVVPSEAADSDVASAENAASASATEMVEPGARWSHRHSHRRRGRERRAGGTRGGSAAAAITGALADGAERLTGNVLGTEAWLRSQHLRCVGGGRRVM